MILLAILAILIVSTIAICAYEANRLCDVG